MDDKKADSIEKAARESYYSQRKSQAKEDLFDRLKSKLITKSILIRTYYPDNATNETSTCFLVKKHDKVYLVTNYHVLPAKNFNDTALRNNSYFPDIPCKAVVYFHGIVNRTSYPVVFDISKLKIYTVPNRSKKLYGQSAPRSIVDAVFIPLNINDNRILIDTVDLNNGYLSKEIAEHTLISIWGYRDENISEGEYCKIDTAVTLPKSPLWGNDFMYFKCTKRLQGDSGAPVYIHSGSKYIFAGMHSCELYDDGGGTPKPLSIGGFVSNSTLKNALARYVP